MDNLKSKFRAFRGVYSQTPNMSLNKSILIDFEFLYNRERLMKFNLFHWFIFLLYNSIFFFDVDFSPFIVLVPHHLEYSNIVIN